MLSAAGYERLDEMGSWQAALRPGGKYYFTRNGSAIVAFAVGSSYQPGGGFNIIGAHTDSPCPKIKPLSKASAHGYLQVGVAPYGGGLWHTWFDRDLSIAGRALVRDAKSGSVTPRLVKIAKPIMRIPTLAIHLSRTVNSEGFKPNFQTHMLPVLATSIKDELNKPAGDGTGTVADAAAGKKRARTEGGSGGDGGEGGGQVAAAGVAGEPTQAHHSVLVRLLASELGVAPEDIVDVDLQVCDTQPSAVGGIYDEFIFSGRLDNLHMSWCALKALADTTSGARDSLAGETGVRMVALFDHEEVGSSTAVGAGSPMMRDCMSRVSKVLGQGEEGVCERAVQRSFLVSADMAHGVHPNYAEKHEPHHRPAMHKGLVIKHNANQRYVTTGVSASLFRELATRNGLPVQEFCVRNDMGCGSTIGPITSAKIGMRAVDVGPSQFSMHSVREMCGVDDVAFSVEHFRLFFDQASAMLEMIDVEYLPSCYAVLEP